MKRKSTQGKKSTNKDFEKKSKEFKRLTREASSTPPKSKSDTSIAESEEKSISPKVIPPVDNPTSPIHWTPKISRNKIIFLVILIMVIVYMGKTLDFWARFGLLITLFTIIFAFLKIFFAFINKDVYLKENKELQKKIKVHENITMTLFIIPPLDKISEGIYHAEFEILLIILISVGISRAIHILIAMIKGDDWF